MKSNSCHCVSVSSVLATTSSLFMTFNFSRRTLSLSQILRFFRKANKYKIKKKHSPVLFFSFQLIQNQSLERKKITTPDFIHSVTTVTLCTVNVQSHLYSKSVCPQDGLGVHSSCQHPISGPIPHCFSKYTRVRNI